MHACQLLDRLANESRLQELNHLLDHDDFILREAAVTPYARIAGVRGLRRLLQAYERGFAEGLDNDGPTADITGLVERCAAEATPILLQMLASEDDCDRSNAAWLLGYVRPLISPDPLLDALHDRSPSLGGNAAGSLAGFKNDGRVFEALATGLADPDEQVRVDAASALEYLGDRREAHALRAMANDPAGRVREFAAHAIERLEDQA